MYLLIPTLLVTANSPTEIPMAGHSTYPTKASKMDRGIDEILDKELGSFVKKRSADLPNIHSLSGGFYGKFEPHYSRPSSLHQPTPTYHPRSSFLKTAIQAEDSSLFQTIARLPRHDLSHPLECVSRYFAQYCVSS